MAAEDFIRILENFQGRGIATPTDFKANTVVFDCTEFAHDDSITQEILASAHKV